MIRKGLLLIAELALTAAFVIGAYLVYQLWFTNQVADGQALEISKALQTEFDSVDSNLESASEAKVSRVSNFQVEAIGLAYIPRLKSDVWATPILVGVSERELAMGVGYYPGAALPGQAGNFAIAAHRATHGEPFAGFEKLVKGDKVFIQSSDGWYEYELIANKKIPDSSTWVLDAKPKGLDVESDHIITLTTCDPRWNSVRRWAWWGVLVSHSETAPAELEALGDL